MAKRFRLAGGKVAIWDGHTDTAPFDNPTGNLSRVKFHSSLDYVRVIDVKSYTLTLPAIPSTGSGQGTGGRQGLRTNLYTLGPHGRPGQPFVIGKITVSGVPVAFTGSVPVSQIAAVGTPDPHEPYARFLSLGVDATNITAYEYSVQSGDASSQDWTARPAVTFPITVYVTDVLL